MSSRYGCPLSLTWQYEVVSSIAVLLKHATLCCGPTVDIKSEAEPQIHLERHEVMVETDKCPWCHTGKCGLGNGPVVRLRDQGARIKQAPPNLLRLRLIMPSVFDHVILNVASLLFPPFSPPSSTSITRSCCNGTMLARP